MKLSVMLMSFGREIRSGLISIPAVIDLCRELGLDGVEITDTEVDALGEDQWQDMLREAGLELAMYIIRSDFVLDNQAAVVRVVEHTHREIDRAARLGATKVMLIPGNPKEGIPDELGRERIAFGLRACAAYGRVQGVQVTNENYGARVHFRGKIRHIEEFQAKAPDLWFTYDNGNFLLGGEDPLFALDRLYDRLVHVHLKDWTIVTEEEGGLFPVPDRPGFFYREAVVGAGVMPTRQIIKALREKGYTGYLSIEHGGRIPGREGLAKAVDFLRGIT